MVHLENTTLKLANKAGSARLVALWCDPVLYGVAGSVRLVSECLGRAGCGLVRYGGAVYGVVRFGRQGKSGFAL